MEGEIKTGFMDWLRELNKYQYGFHVDVKYPVLQGTHQQNTANYLNLLRFQDYHTNKGESN